MWTRRIPDRTSYAAPGNGTICWETPSSHRATASANTAACADDRALHRVRDTLLALEFLASSDRF
jgi:hypothetical protein